MGARAPLKRSCSTRAACRRCSPPLSCPLPLLPPSPPGQAHANAAGATTSSGTSLEELSKKVAEVYVRTGFDYDASISSLQARARPFIMRV